MLPKRIILGLGATFIVFGALLSGACGDDNKNDNGGTATVAPGDLTPAP
ncbi:MAG: hypothetical protein WBD55_12395 [Dehalococcoidia bacterium]